MDKVYIVDCLHRDVHSCVGSTERIHGRMKVSLVTVYSDPCSHFVANSTVHWIASCLTWWILESNGLYWRDRKIVTIRVHLSGYFPGKNVEWWSLTWYAHTYGVLCECPGVTGRVIVGISWQLRSITFCQCIMPWYLHMYIVRVIESFGTWTELVGMWVWVHTGVWFVGRSWP